MKVSVCMAAFNGEAFIQRQIASILPQLKETDELIVVDDCSSDNTYHLVKNMNDSRIILCKNDCNLGFLKSFEKSILLATGDIIFLADQDDIWLDDKVDSVVELFSREDIDIVFHDAIIVDESNNVLFPSFKSLRRISLSPFYNFFKNTVTGCCLAFRCSVRDKVLPIPSDAVYHDRWIVIMAAILSLKIKFLDKSLLYYVRHGQNASPFRRKSVVKIIIERFYLLRSILKFLIYKC